MSDEQETIAPAEQPQAAIDTSATTPVDEPERILSPEEAAAPEVDPAIAEDEFEEFEWNGKQIRGPKGLKDGVLMQADYTKKTQTVAEKAKALEAREAEIARKAEATEAELDARAELRTVKTSLAEFAKLTPADWQAHADDAPKETADAWREFQLLQQQEAALTDKVTKAATERTASAQQDLAKRVQDTLDFAAKEIPGWKPELTSTLVKFAHEQGVPEDALKANWSPVFYKLLHQAHIGSLALQKQSTAQKLPVTQVAPLATVGGKSSPSTTSDLASADMEAYVAARKRGVGGKALR